MSKELYHYGVKGMKWGVRRADKYEAKAEKYRSRAKDYSDPIKRSLYNEKSERLMIKSRLAREGKDDIKKLNAANKLKGGYIDTQGLLRGPYADAVNDIRTKKGERYASALMRKHANQQAYKVIAGASALSVAYAAGMTYVINKMK